MNHQLSKLQLSVRRWLALFMIGLVLSGATAFDVVSGMSWIKTNIDVSWANGWIDEVHRAVQITSQQYPYLFYGYDWMAFAHIVIAISFIGPYMDPVKNEWVIVFGMIACAFVIPVALLFGAIRHIPLWWRLLDCSFGVLGFIPLSIVFRKIQVLKRILAVTKTRSFKAAGTYTVHYKRDI